jgi:hypothetical protein
MAADKKDVESQQRFTSNENESEDDSPAVKHDTDKGQEKDLSTNVDNTEPTDALKDKDVEAQQKVDPQHRNVLAGEDYSAFTVPQKRAIIVAGSFLAWFSPVSRPRCWCTHRD